jgi:hypothetical protein
MILLDTNRVVDVIIDIHLGDTDHSMDRLFDVEVLQLTTYLRSRDVSFPSWIEI